MNDDEDRIRMVAGDECGGSHGRIRSEGGRVGQRGRGKRRQEAGGAVKHW